MIQRIPSASLLAVSILGAVGCQSGTTEGLGRLPRSVVLLYDQAAPDGIIEIEVDRDGSLREIEADIPVEDLPEHVRAVALERLPGATITGAEREIQPDGEGWEVKLLSDGVAWEVVVDEDGGIVETEQELDLEDAPPEVLETADLTIGGTYKSVELITRGSAAEYHVKKAMDGASYKLIVAPDGTLIRAVREARAELEIPLR